MAVDKAAEKSAPKDSEATNSDAILSLAQTMSKVVEHMDNGRVQQVPYANARIPTPWNPEGKKAHERPKLSRNTYQNGGRVVAERLTEEEIHAFNKLKPGRYGPERAWVVVKRGDGSVELRYPNKSVEERMELGKYTSRGILGILDMVNDEYVAKADKRRRGVIDEEADID